MDGNSTMESTTDYIPSSTDTIPYSVGNAGLDERTSSHLTTTDRLTVSDASSFAPNSTDGLTLVGREPFNEASPDVTWFVWGAVAAASLLILLISVITVIVWRRQKIKRRQIQKLNNFHNVTFRFTRTSNLVLEERKKTEAPFGSKLQSPNANIPPSVTNNLDDNSRANSSNPLQIDLYEKDSDNGSWRLEYSTFSAVNTRYDSNEKLSQR